MRTPAPTALRAVLTGSKPQACRFIASRRFAISQRSFCSSSKRLHNNDPAKTEDREWEVITPPKQEEKPQEVQEVVENVNGSYPPAKPKNLSGYGSAAKRAGRNIRKVKELPPPQIPKWFFEENVVLREDGTEQIHVRLVESEISESSQSNAASTSPTIASLDEIEQEDKSELGKTIGDGIEHVPTPQRKAAKEPDVETNPTESKQSETEERDVQALKAQAPEATVTKDRFDSFFQISSKSGTYGIDENIMHEVFSMVSSGLLAPSIDQVDQWISSKHDLVLYHPKNGGSNFLDVLVQHLASVCAADLVRLDPQDIAEIGGNYLEEGRDTHIKSLCSLGYDAYQTVFLRASQVSDQNIEEDADDVEQEEQDDDDGDESRSKPNPFRSSNVSVIPISRLGGSIIDILGSTLTSVYPPSSPKSSTNVGALGQAIDITNDLKTSIFIDTILNASARKRGSENDTGSASYFAAGESSTEATTEEIKGRTDGVDEAETRKDTKSNSNSLIDDTPIIEPTNNYKQTKGKLIVMIRDYMEINMTSSGAKILNKLHEIVRARRKEGQSIMVIGTSSSNELTPSLSKSGFKSLQAEPENGPTRTIVTPCRTQSSGSLDQDHSLRISAINFRNLQDMFRKISPRSGEMESVQSPPRPLKDEICKRIWPLDLVHHLATITLGIKKDERKLSATHVNNALMTLSGSEKAKSNWIEHEKDEEKKNVTPTKKPVDSSGEDNLRFMSVADGEERMKKLRKICNPHEKKLLNGVVDPDSIRTTFSDVHAPRETVEALKTLTSLSLVRPDAFKYGVLATDRIPGLLLYGPPGTGKTLLAKAVAKESGATVLEVSGSDVYDMFVGEGEKNVRAIFTLAKKLTPCIVFIDEADAILGSRGGSSNRTTHRELINQFLREWDGMNELSAFIMVATNRPFDLDEASLRRLPRRLLIDLPTEKDREAILKIHLKDELLDPAVSLGDLASQTPFYSGSDLKNFSVAAALSCVREEFDQAAASTPNAPNPYQYPAKRTLHPRHFTHAMEEISASVSEDMGSLSAIRKFDEKFGDRKGRRKKRGGYGFETVKEGEKRLSDAARVRDKG